MQIRGVVVPDGASVVDLRSDAITQPTEEMWAAMRDARLGWALVGEDPSVNALEAMAAELTGKEAAVFAPTGTMANLVALMSHTERGDQIILEASAHILWSEEWSFASLCGLVARPVPGTLGFMPPSEIEHAIRDRRSSHRPKTSLICLENTHNAAGGTVLNAGQITATSVVAQRYGVPIHMDGARVFNACVALGVTLRELAAGVDTLTLNLNKGLSAPEGALLCGSRSFVERSRVNLRRLGATIHTAGIVAAAGIVALNTMLPQLAEDHRRARILARGLAQTDGMHVELDAVHTNIVMVRVDPSLMFGAALIDLLQARGIRAFLYAEQVVRFVTHRGISDADVSRALDEIQDVVHQQRARQ